MFLYGAHYLRKNISVEIDNAIQVEFRGKNIEEMKKIILLDFFFAFMLTYFYGSEIPKKFQVPLQKTGQNVMKIHMKIAQAD